MLTMQEMYDAVARHLLTQNRKAQGTVEDGSLPGFGSMYYGHNNTRCALGCLIPAYEYNKKMEGLLVGDLLTKFPRLKRCIPHEELAGALQKTHDFYAPKEWPYQLRSVARAHNLNDVVVDELAPGKGLELEEEPVKLFIVGDITFTFGKTPLQDDFNTYASAFSYTTGKKFSLDFVLETAEQTAEREAKEAITKAAVRQPSELALSP